MLRDHQHQLSNLLITTLGKLSEVACVTIQKRSEVAREIMAVLWLLLYVIVFRRDKLGGVIIRSSDSDSCLSFTVKSALRSSLTDEQPKISDRQVPCRKKGRPKKKKDAKNKEGKPVKTKKRKKIVSFF